MARCEHPANGSPRLVAVPSLAAELGGLDTDELAEAEAAIGEHNRNEFTVLDMTRVEVGDQPIDRLLVHLAVTHETTPHIAYLVRQVGRAHGAKNLRPWLVTATGHMAAAITSFLDTRDDARTDAAAWEANGWTGVTVIDLGALANDLGLRIADGRVVAPWA